LDLYKIIFTLIGSFLITLAMSLNLLIKGRSTGFANLISNVISLNKLGI